LVEKVSSRAFSLENSSGLFFWQYRFAVQNIHKKRKNDEYKQFMVLRFTMALFCQNLSLLSKMAKFWRKNH